MFHSFGETSEDITSQIDIQNDIIPMRLNDRDRISHSDNLRLSSRLSILKERVYGDEEASLPGDISEMRRINRRFDNGKIASEEHDLMLDAVSRFVSREESEELSPKEEYDYSSHSPISYMAEEYKDRSEEEKILLLRTVGGTLGMYYDEAMRKDPDQQGISDEEMWKRLKNGDDIGMCGDVHKELTKLANALGFTGDVITVNTDGEIHIISRLLKKDGSPLLIDYGTGHQGKSEEELIDNYHLQNKAISSESYIGDPNTGQVIGIQETPMQKRTGEIVYISSKDAFPTDDGIDVRLGTSAEFRLQWSKSYGDKQYFAFTERMALYGVNQDFYGIGMTNSSDSKDYGAQFTYSKYQDAKSLSGYFTKKGKLGGVGLSAGIEAKATMNSGGGVGDIGMLLNLGAEKDGYTFGLSGKVVPKDLGVNKISTDNARIIPTLSLGFTSAENQSGRTFSGGVDMSEIKQSINIGTQKGTSGMNLELSHLKDSLSGKMEEAITIKQSYVLGKGEIYTKIVSNTGDIGGELGFKIDF